MTPNETAAPSAMDFAIYIDTVSVHTPCPVCGADGRHNEQTGQGIYVKTPTGWSWPVCDACVRKHAPRLAEILDAWREKVWAECHTGERTMTTTVVTTKIDEALVQLRQAAYDAYNRTKPDHDDDAMTLLLADGADDAFNLDHRVTRARAFLDGVATGLGVPLEEVVKLSDLGDFTTWKLPTTEPAPCA